MHSWHIRNSEYEVELDGRIVAMLKLNRAQLWGPLITPTEGTLLRLDDYKGEPVYARVKKVVHPRFKNGGGFVQEGMPDWDTWRIEQELAKRSHPDSTNINGRVVVERVKGLSDQAPWAD